MRRDSDRPARPDARSKLPRGLRPDVVLYVEDDDDNWDVAELRLSKHYAMLRAKDDESACRIVRERRGEIDIILMDIELRGSTLNGVELTELLRGNRLPSRADLPAYAHDLPVLSKPIVYVTAHGARYSNVRLLLSGADKVIAKPVDFTALQVALSELLLERTVG
jgi:CheY-like chemotaxis protein